MYLLMCGKNIIELLLVDRSPLCSVSVDLGANLSLFLV